MLLTGYHGTSQYSASKIIDEKRFDLSSADTDWLGPGIYFYPDVSDAYNWRDSEAIIHCIVKVDDRNYLDLDSVEGKKLYKEMEDHICTTLGVTTAQKNAEKNQCALMKMIWDANPNLDVIAASFATTRTRYRTLLDFRPRRKEFCVRNNTCIKYMGLIARGDLDD